MLNAHPRRSRVAAVPRVTIEHWELSIGQIACPYYLIGSTKPQKLKNENKVSTGH
jgi:hypothetical protein